MQNYDDKIKDLFQSIRAEKHSMHKKIEALQKELDLRPVIEVEDPKQSIHIDRLRARVEELEKLNLELEHEKQTIEHKLDRLKNISLD